MMTGKAKTTSVIRIRTSSTQPPKKPATRPTTVPIKAVTVMSNRPTGTDSLAPYRTREVTSRPAGSVPSQCADEGPSRGTALWSSGS
jgi:hypothetical protein